MEKTKSIAVSAVLISLALSLSYIENFIPLSIIIPLPGIKLGLANVVTVAALYIFGTKFAFKILVIRCALGSLFQGGITGLAFSLLGGIFAMSVMTFSKKFPIFSVYGVSVLGAAAHNVGQIFAGMVLIRSTLITAYLPYLLLISVFTGLFTGALSDGILSVLSLSQCENSYKTIRRNTNEKKT